MIDEKDSVDQNAVWEKSFKPYLGYIFSEDTNQMSTAAVRRSNSTKKSGSVKKNTDVDDSAEMAKRNEQYFKEGSYVTQQYHLKVLEQTQELTHLFTIVFACVTAFICLMAAYVIIFKVEQANALIPMLVAAFVDLLAGVLIVVLKLISKTRDDFFKESLKSEYYGKIIMLIQGVCDEEKQVELIRGCINDYFAYIFKESTEAEYFDKIVGLIDGVKTEEKKVELIKPIVQNFVTNNTGTGPAALNAAAAHLAAQEETVPQDT